MNEELKSVVTWLNENYNQESENYSIFFGSKPGVVKYNDHIAISFWGCGAVVCIYDMLYFIEEDDGHWQIKEEEDKEYGHEYGFQTSFSIGWAEGFANAVNELKKYVDENGKPVYYSGTDVVCQSNMLVNKKSGNTSRVKFISYTGEYPNLCSGVLVLEIDGVEYKFGHEYQHSHYDEKKKTWVQTDEDPDHPNFEQFWHSGGGISSDEDWNFDVWQGDWEINVKELPEQFWDVAAEIDVVINENIPKGCCGGCV